MCFSICIVLSACRSENKDTDPTIVVVQDQDGDGFAEEDCDDDNALINPQEEERRDGIVDEDIFQSLYVG
jgi:hypothetical protein